MGVLYEIVSTPFAYAERPHLSGDEMFAGAPKRIDFGPGRLQHCIIWEPAEAVHEETVFWFHGGAFLVGTPESMIDAARVWCHEGYRSSRSASGLSPMTGFRHRQTMPTAASWPLRPGSGTAICPGAASLSAEALREGSLPAFWGIATSWQSVTGLIGEQFLRS